MLNVKKKKSIKKTIEKKKEGESGSSRPIGQVPYGNQF